MNNNHCSKMLLDPKINCEECKREDINPENVLNIHISPTSKNIDVINNFEHAYIVQYIIDDVGDMFVEHNAKDNGVLFTYNKQKDGICLLVKRCTYITTYSFFRNLNTKKLKVNIHIGRNNVIDINNNYDIETRN